MPTRKTNAITGCASHSGQANNTGCEVSSRRWIDRHTRDWMFPGKPGIDRPRSLASSCSNSSSCITLGIITEHAWKIPHKYLAMAETPTFASKRNEAIKTHFVEGNSHRGRWIYRVCPNNPHSSKSKNKQMKTNPINRAAFAILALVAIAGLSSCATTTKKNDGLPHPPPTKDHRDHPFHNN